MSSQVIHKFPLLVQAEQTINIFTGAWILDFQVQNGVPTIWAMVDTSHKKFDRDILMFATGENIDCIANLEFIGTAQLQNGLVFHYFQRVAF